MSLISQSKEHELILCKTWVHTENNMLSHQETTIVSILAKRILNWDSERNIFLNPDGIQVWGNWYLWFK